mmetsp:Transcript_149573/g.260971  ORF Transcript_149573/g.260971 Transcript_149573/m.260971 type:complete len:631 (+) Transcript_149573:64-1956(+)
MSLSMAGLPVRLVALVFVTGILQSAALKPIEWQRRTTYQLITDRFALPPGGKDTCNENPDDCMWGSYCGGTWWGVLDKLDYIQGMGFDAIYISPIVKNIPCGYHGFWNGDIWTIEPRFGGEEGLQALLAECRRRNIAVMLDTVYNHMGPPYFLDTGRPTDFDWIVKQYSPFNKKEYFHQSYMVHCWAEAPDATQREREICWMGVLEGAVSDLAHEHPFVSDQFIQWTKHLVDKYHIDGIRADAVPYVNKTFWQRLKREALADTYIVGEVVVKQVLEDYSASYQNTPEHLVMSQKCQSEVNHGPDCLKAVEFSRAAIQADHVTGDILDGLLSTIMKSWIRKVFQTKDGTYENSLEEFAGMYNYVYNVYKNLGNGAIFIDTHDDARWLHKSPDWRTYQTAITMTFFLPGVPIAYYGAEQGMVGPGGFGTNASRAPLWDHSYDTQHALYRFTSRLVKARQAAISALGDEYLDDEPYFYVFPPSASSVISWWRANALVVLSQLNSKIPCACIQTYLPSGTCMYDALSEDPDNTICVSQEGLLQVDADAAPRVFFQKGCDMCAHVQTTCSQTCSGAPAQFASPDATSSPPWSSASGAVAGLFCACGLMVWLLIHARLRSQRTTAGQQPLLTSIID